MHRFIFQRQPQEVICKNSLLKIFSKLTGKEPVPETFFDPWRPVHFWKLYWNKNWVKFSFSHFFVVPQTLRVNNVAGLRQIFCKVGGGTTYIKNNKRHWNIWLMGTDDVYYRLQTLKRVVQRCSVKKMFSKEFCGISKITMFYRTPQVVVSDYQFYMVEYERLWLYFLNIFLYFYQDLSFILSDVWKLYFSLKIAQQKYIF